jgi:hypothetical protein
MTNATIGLGTTFKYRTALSPLAYTAIGEVVSIQPPQPTRETADATHLGSPNGVREYVGTLRDGGDAEATFNYTPAAYGIASDLFLEDEVQNFQIGYPDGSTDTFDAIVTGYPSEPIEVDGIRRFRMPMKVTGLPVFDDGE